MIDKLKSASPLLASRPPASTSKGVDSQAIKPNDGFDWSRDKGFRLATPADVEKLKAAEAPQVKAQGLAEIGRKVGLGAALAVTGVVGLAGAAQAQTTAQVQTTQQQASKPLTLAEAVRASLPQRDQTPVRVSSTRDVVNQFQAGRQIYVVGNPQFKGQPLSSADYSKFQSVMKEHPNAYLVLVDNSDNIRHDDHVLSLGIGQHPGFTGNVDSRTGDKNGEVFMIYFHTTDRGFIDRTGKDRAMFMRSEQLLDEAGVGEGNFVDRETLQNKELFNTYIQGIQAGQDVPTALNSVLNKIDQGVNSYITNYVQGAQTSVTAGRTALSGIEPKIKAFQNQHGTKGMLGNPDLEGWKNQLNRAQSAVDDRRYELAANLAKSVQSSIAAYESALNTFGNAPQLAQQAQALVDQAEQQLSGLENNGPAQSARQAVQQAKQEMAAYQASYSANNLDYQPHLTRASQLSQQAVADVAASRSQTENIKNAKLYGGGALAAVLLITGVGLNWRARKKKGEAEGEVDEALARLGEKSKELVRIMNAESFEDVSQYSGLTQKMANDLIASTAESLALMGGGEKFIAEARSMIAGKTLGQRLKNLFATGNFQKAVHLLTGDQKLSFDLNDSKRAHLEAGTPAEAWREQILANVPAQPFEESLRGVLDQMEARAATNDRLVTTIQTKSKEVGNYLEEVRGQAQGVNERSLKLQEAGKDDGLFVASSVSKRLMPFVLGDEAQPGLLAKGGEVKGKDPVRAWTEFGDVGKRMASDGGQIVDLGERARADLLPALKAADEVLLANGVQTAWAHLKKDEFSIALDRSGEKAVSEPVDKQVADLSRSIAALQARVETTVEQDKERREVSPGLISDAESDVQTAREGLSKALQAAGVFAQGRPDQVLREPDRDPTTQTEKSHKDWEGIKGNLDLGKVEEAGTLLQNIRSQTQLAHDLVKQTRDAFNNYTATAQERASRRDNIGKSIPSNYAESLKRIQAAYLPSAQKLVAAEVHSDSNSKVGTVGDYLTQAQGQLENSGSLNSQAQANYERAYLLTSRDQLNDSDAQLKLAKSNLEAITSAETALNNHQAEAEGELRSLAGRVQSTAGKTSAEYVRSRAKSLVQQAQAEVDKVKAVVMAKPADPYAAKAALAAVENLRQQAESAISSDYAAFTAANSAISSAESEISSAESKISSVASQSWSTYVSDYGTVSHSVNSGLLSGARSTLSSARSELSNARSRVSSQDYEGAKSEADSASSTASRAESQASSVESSEYSTYRSMVSSAEAIAQAKRDEEARQAAAAAAAAQAAADAANSSSSSSSGSDDSGSSGSTGGGW
ncbi:hypothetical protein JST97_25385 [bacterium]|nr:hypothetical protein [bacterium]